MDTREHLADEGVHQAPAGADMQTANDPQGTDGVDSTTDRARRAATVETSPLDSLSEGQHMDTSGEAPVDMNNSTRGPVGLPDMQEDVDEFELFMEEVKAYESERMKVREQNERFKLELEADLSQKDRKERAATALGLQEATASSSLTTTTTTIQQTNLGNDRSTFQNR